jgi:hypothetical protein
MQKSNASEFHGLLPDQVIVGPGHKNYGKRTTTCREMPGQFDTGNIAKLNINQKTFYLGRLRSTQKFFRRRKRFRLIAVRSQQHVDGFTKRLVVLDNPYGNYSLNHEMIAQFSSQVRLAAAARDMGEFLPGGLLICARYLSGTARLEECGDQRFEACQKRRRNVPSARRANRPPTAGSITRLAYAQARTAGLALNPILKASNIARRQIDNPRAPVVVVNQIKFLNLTAIELDDPLLLSLP